LVRFFTKEFFDDFAEILSRDRDLVEITKGLNTSILFICEGRSSAFKATVSDMKISVAEAGSEGEAEFKFLAPYPEWVKIAKGEARFQGEVVAGRIRFKGSMPKMLLYLNKVLKLERRLLDMVRKMNLEY